MKISDTQLSKHSKRERGKERGREGVGEGGGRRRKDEKRITIDGVWD